MHVSMCRDVACVASGHVHGTAPAHSATEPDHCDDTCFHDRSISTVILEDASQPVCTVCVRTAPFECPQLI